MEEIIFACPASGEGLEELLLARSIREFGGKYADSQLWFFTTKKKNDLDKDRRKELRDLSVESIPLKFEKSEMMAFPFMQFTFAAAAAEKMAVDKTNQLVWLDKNLIIIKEPERFILAKEKKLAYRPVHHTLIGSHYEKPLDDFWKIIYEKCNVSEELVFPMQTHVDGNILRPYINSGFLSVRPEAGLLQNWWEKYLELHNDLKLVPFYQKDELYAIFVHQAILSALILTQLGKEELQELPFEYNYPLHLYPESLPEFRPKDFNELTAIRFYLKKLQDPVWRKKIPLTDPLKSWLLQQVTHTKQNDKAATASGKEKFGNIPLIYPIPIALAGALVDGKPNFETVGDVGVMGLKPAIVYLSSGNTHHTNKGIIEHNTFSINFPSTDMLTVTDYCGTVSGRDVDKAKFFTVFYGESGTAPMIKECPVNLECKVIKEFSIEHRQIFIAKVEQTYVSTEFIEEKKGRKAIADMSKLDPIIYSLDNCYYSIGKRIGVGYKESKNIKKKK